LTGSREVRVDGKVQCAVEYGSNLSVALSNDLKTFLVFPYMDHDLCGLLKNPSLDMTDSLIKLYMLQLLDGVAYMHHVSMSRPVNHSKSDPFPFATE
jgi:serine/threonine-protein kinase BUR1